MDAGYDHPPRTGSFGRAYAIRPYTGTQTPLTPLGKLKNAPLNVSDASEGSKHAAEGFRGVGAFFTNRIKNYHS